MTYPQVIRYLNSLINYEKKTSFSYKQSFKLERIREFLRILNNPQDSLKCIHIAGTKGKGSTCAFLAYILREAGYRTGLYTSPHLLDFKERVRILNPESRIPNPKRNEFEGTISSRGLADLVERLKPEIEGYNKNSKYGTLSFFEIYTALAFIYFQQKKADLVVLETGLGGRLDATNVVNPLVCGITSLSYEHTHILGTTLKKIAKEKAGIIKIPNSKFQIPKPIVISAPQEKEAAGVIRNKCRAKGVKLYEVGKDIFYQGTKGGFRIKGAFNEYSNLKIKLLGEHQLINAAVAVGIIEALRFYGFKVSVDSIRQGLYNTVWPGRCEIISKNPLVILDGAQNVASAEALGKTIKENFRYQKLILVLGISQDKDIKGISRALYSLADKVILTQANNPRASEPSRLACYFKGKVIFKTNKVKDALDKAAVLSDEKDLILITGSLFVVGEARSLF